MAIAIPSVTKYITQSRKKTITTTIGNYISALINQVNNMEYIFTSTNTIYAVPIECIALERGGTDPFGEWYQASNSYWAYVLVQYDDSTSSYTYGFTFKDSAGYGLYPTTSDKLEESGNQISTDLDLNKPRNGSLENISQLSNWVGFNVNDDINLKILKATLDGGIGDGKTTCTLVQKGNNYSQVQDEINDMSLIKRKYDNDNTFWVYDEQIKTITFEDGINIPDDAYMSWDVSSTGNGKVMAYIIPNSSNSSFYDLFIQGDGEIYANKNSSYLFRGFKNVEKINNINLFNTSNVTNMSDMFYGMENLVSLDVTGFDTSNVTNMSAMFRGCSKLKEINVSNFDTSNVTSMFEMFTHMYELESLDVSNFDTSKVTAMESMFNGLRSLTTLDLSNFDTRKVTNMNWMFHYSYNLTYLNVSSFNTSNVTTMNGMFGGLGKLNTLDLTNFNTSKVTSMKSMFEELRLTTLDLSSFDTSKVTNMEKMFSNDFSLRNLKLNKASFEMVTNSENIFYNFSNSISIVAKDDVSRNWIQDKLGSNKGTIITVPEL